MNFMLEIKSEYYFLLEAIEFEIILKVGIILPSSQQATRENVIQMTED